MITSYAIHTAANPFLRTDTAIEKPSRVANSVAAAARARSLWLGAAVEASFMAGRRQLQDLNRLEATMLRAAIAVLLGGMMVREPRVVCIPCRAEFHR
jgi:hypothetical protein